MDYNLFLYITTMAIIVPGKFEVSIIIIIWGIWVGGEDYNMELSNRMYVGTTLS